MDFIKIIRGDIANRTDYFAAVKNRLWQLFAEFVLSWRIGSRCRIMVAMWNLFPDGV